MSGHLSTIENWELLAKQAEFRPAKMATLCGISHRQLQRHFKELHQTTPRQWLRELQCRIARQLISEGHASKVVAIELNFANATHLCREFRKAFGDSPQAFAIRIPGGRHFPFLH